MTVTWSRQHVRADRAASRSCTERKVRTYDDANHGCRVSSAPGLWEGSPGRLGGTLGWKSSVSQSSGRGHRSFNAAPRPSMALASVYPCSIWLDHPIFVFISSVQYCPRPLPFRVYKKVLVTPLAPWCKVHVQGTDTTTQYHLPLFLACGTERTPFIGAVVRLCVCVSRGWPR